MASLLGWKDILRPIRDGYRHLFPTPDTGPTPDERRKQRNLDKLKGFAYFDTFHQLESWTENDSDPVQRANTPLLSPKSRDAKKDLGKADILLIHDYSGNYHDYESVQATGVGAELYSCEYLQFVDLFIYFSHKLVCVPPPTWTNTLHRNGVKALGTILIEPQTEGSERLLRHDIDGKGISFPVAKTLACIAAYYGFDGWLVNIEKPFPNDIWDVEILEAFLHQLRTEMGERMRLIWYDALTTSNKVSYQNALNSSNLRFAAACGSILTNYCWKDIDAEESLQLALANKLRPQDIFFGIDVWAQNKSSFTHPRVTYPEYGGGGTNTGVAVAKLAGLGLSAGIFAPAWSFEHFPGHGRDVERAVWQGAALVDGMECSCGDCASRHQSNRNYAILKTGKERAAGSESFFYTDFGRAFAVHKDQPSDIFDGHTIRAQLGCQSILPSPFNSGDDSPAVELSHHFKTGLSVSCLVIEATQFRSGDDEMLEAWLPLYKIDMPADGSLEVSICCLSVALSQFRAVVSFYLETTETVHLSTIAMDKKDMQRIVCAPTSRMPESRMQELGVHVRGPVLSALGKITQLLEISRIRIIPMPISKTLRSVSVSINDVRLEHHGQGDCTHTRLCWSFQDHATVSLRDIHIPYSNVTGPFSHFLIRVEGVLLGTAYALEHVLSKTFMENNAGRVVAFELIGVGFHGNILVEKETSLCL